MISLGLTFSGWGPPDWRQLNIKKASMCTWHGPTEGPNENGARRGGIIEGEGYPIKCCQCRQGHHVLRRLQVFSGDFPRPQSWHTWVRAPRVMWPWRPCGAGKECLLLPEGASNIASTTVLMGEGGRVSCMIKPRVIELINLLELFPFCPAKYNYFCTSRVDIKFFSLASLAS